MLKFKEQEEENQHFKQVESNLNWRTTQRAQYNGNQRKTEQTSGTILQIEKDEKLGVLTVDGQ